MDERESREVEVDELVFTRTPGNWVVIEDNEKDLTIIMSAKQLITALRELGWEVEE